MAKRKKGEKVDGWIAFDKPLEMTSTQAVGFVRRMLNAQKAGHAGTLDPLATGVLPIALGEATKTVPYVMDGKKVYQFTVKWGEETSTDDKEGDITQTSDKRPSKEQIKATLSDFSGEIIQTPPMYSAIKIKGEAAYKIARRGDTVEMPKRTVTIHSLSLKSTTKDTATFEAEVSKGTYIRALGRDMGQKLGCYGHIVELIRTQCGPFSLENCISQEKLDVWAKNRQDAPTFLIPVEAALADIPAYRATFEEQKQVLAGHTLTRVHLDSGLMKVVNRYGKVISLVDVDDKGQMHIVRNFNTA